MDRLTARRIDNPAYQGYQILHIGFTLLPIIAGLDKFFNILVDWERYLAPSIAALAPVGPETFMLGIGVVEIIAGLIVAFAPRIGGYVVGVWLLGIVTNLLLAGAFFDIALRDFGLALGAFSLARLADVFEEPGALF